MTVNDVLLPQFGMGMQEAEIIEWKKAVGDQVTAGETLADIGSEKSTIELEAPFSGELVEICAAEGETVEIGALVARIRS